MSNQPTQPRTLFRLPTLARPQAPPAPAPAPAPAAVPEPRPQLVRPAFRPLASSQPTQTQEPAPPPSTAARPVIPAVSLPPPPPPPAPPSTAAPVPAATTRSVPSSPTGRVSAPSASVPVIKPASSVPSSPKAKVAAPSSSVPTSPVDKAPLQAQTFPSTRSVIPSTTTTTARVPTPIPPSQTINPVVQTTPKSPKPRPTAPPPSPLTLPPSQLKSGVESEQNIPMPPVEQKNVLFQKTIEKPKPWLGGNGDSQRENGEFYKSSNVPIGKEEASKEVQTKEIKEKSNGKKNWDSEEMGMRVITIAGENKGAFMELIRSPKKHEAVAYKKGNHKTQSNASESEITRGSDKKGNPEKEEGPKGKETGSKPISAFMNSNVQSVNNSLIYNSSCTHHDPGVHLSLSRKHSAESYVKDRVNGNHT